MPPNRNSLPPSRGSSPLQRGEGPPEVMTWRKASPAIIVAGLFDLVGIFFEFFWFFGPALAAAYCSVTVSDVAVVGGLLATGCVAAATVGGAAVSAFTTPFGVIMAMAVAFIGFLAVGFWVVKTNARIFKANAAGSLWFVGGFGVSMTPLVGVIPAFSLVLWKLYRTQIRVEKAAYAKWKKEQAAAQLQERRRQTAQLMQARAMQEAAAEDARQRQEAEDEELTLAQERFEALKEDLLTESETVRGLVTGPEVAAVVAGIKPAAYVQPPLTGSVVGSRYRYPTVSENDIARARAVLNKHGVHLYRNENEKRSYTPQARHALLHVQRDDLAQKRMHRSGLFSEDEQRRFAENPASFYSNDLSGPKSGYGSAARIGALLGYPLPDVAAFASVADHPAEHPEKKAFDAKGKSSDAGPAFNWKTVNPSDPEVVALQHRGQRIERLRQSVFKKN